VSRRRLLIGAVAAGVVAGALYALSPLTVICIPLVVAMCAWVARELPPDERRWFVALMVLAVVSRLLAIAVLFLSASDARPFEVLFGDELFFKNRSLWLRNIGLRVPISPADVIYAYEDVGVSSYLYVLALLQALVGKAPYGIHVFNSACYITGVVLLFRFVRAAYGSISAFAGLAVLLFLPSLFMWSISAIKEPLYTLVAALELVCALQAARAVQWSARLRWLAGVIVGTVALESVRRGAGIVPIVGVGAGYFFGYVVPRPKWLLATVALLPPVVVAALSIPAIHEPILSALRTGAFYHSGHVLSPGYSYLALRGDYYRDGLTIFTMPVNDVIQYVIRCYVAYVTEPVPWRIESRAMLAYLPEQVFWLLLLALVVIGIHRGIRRDAMLTTLLLAHAFAGASIVAVSSGNIGTLVRHRGLIFPYIAWLAGLGLYQIVHLAVRRGSARSIGGLHAHGYS